MGDRKQKVIPAHYSWNSSIFTRGVVDPIKRLLGWTDENERPVSLKESATGQELDRMKDTAKGAGKLVATGLAFSNPVTASATMAPLITGSQAYFMTEGLKDAYDRITSPNKTATDGAMVALDVAGAVPTVGAIANGAKYVLPTAAKTVTPALITKQISKTKLSTVEPTLNIGWGPKQTINVSRAGEYDQMYFPKRWDVVNEGANPHGVWLQGKYGTPRTDITNPGKGTKAAIARNTFSTRPNKYTGTVPLDKPMVTVGEVPNRSLLSYQADNMGADGLVYNGVYDNGYNNNQVILSFKEPNLNKIKLSEEERLGTPKVERNNIDNAIGRARAGNDRRRLKFLRERHFKEASPNNTIIDDNGNPIKVYHGSPSKFTVFDYERQDQYPDGHFFFSQDPGYAKLVGTWHSSPYESATVRGFYLYDTEKHPLNKFKGYWSNDGTREPLSMSELTSDMANYIMTRQQKTPHTIYGYDAGRSYTPGSYDYAVPYNTQMKLTNPIVFDDKGHFIKLSKRDNFNNPDIRYKQGGILKRVESGKSGIHIKPENRGKLTRLKKRTGKTEAELWKEGNPAVRKMITFARNSRKWKHK